MNLVINPVEIARMLEGYFGIEVPPAAKSLTLTLDFEKCTTEVETKYLATTKPINGDPEK